MNREIAALVVEEHRDFWSRDARHARIEVGAIERAGALRTILRGVAVWLVIIIVEVFHGVVRTMFLAPVLGDFRARQVAVFTGSVLILMVATLFIKWIRPANAGAAFVVGTVWLVLTLAFEIVFGRYVVGAPWSRIASDYDLLRGGLLPIGLLVLTAAPLTAAKFRRVEWLVARITDDYH